MVQLSCSSCRQNPQLTREKQPFRTKLVELHVGQWQWIWLAIWGELPTGDEITPVETIWTMKFHTKTLLNVSTWFLFLFAHGHRCEYSHRAMTRSPRNECERPFMMTLLIITPVILIKLRFTHWAMLKLIELESTKLVTNQICTHTCKYCL